MRMVGPAQVIWERRRGSWTRPCTWRAERPRHRARGQDEPRRPRVPAVLAHEQQRQKHLGADEGRVQQRRGRPPPPGRRVAAARCRRGGAPAWPGRGRPPRRPPRPAPRCCARRRPPAAPPPRARRRGRRAGDGACGPAAAGARRVVAADVPQQRHEQRPRRPTVSVGTARKIHRHEACSTTSPAMPGPTRPGTTHAAANAAKKRGCRCRRHQRADEDVQRHEQQPAAEALDRPADREDLHARGQPGHDEPGAERRRLPATREPRGPRASLHAPPTAVATSWAASGAPLAHGVERRSPPRSAVTAGIAVPTARASNATSVISDDGRDEQQPDEVGARFAVGGPGAAVHRGAVVVIGVPGGTAGWSGCGGGSVRGAGPPACAVAVVHGVDDGAGGSAGRTARGVARRRRPCALCRWPRAPRPGAVEGGH